MQNVAYIQSQVGYCILKTYTGLPFQSGFPGGSDGKESACSVRELGSLPGLEDSLEEGMATHTNILA